MGFLDKAKKLAEQAKEVAEQAREAAEGALGDARARASGGGGSGGGGGGGGPSGAPTADPVMGTPYQPGMLGRPGWREEGLTDPAAVLPIADRDRAGVPHTTRSEIVEEPFGMGRRWTAGDRAVGLFYRLYPDQREWAPPAGAAPMAAVEGAWEAALPDGRALVLFAAGPQQVVLETRGLDSAAGAALAGAVAAQLAAG